MLSTKTYLFIYNAAQAAGWGVCLFKLIQTAAQTSDPALIYASASKVAGTDG